MDKNISSFLSLMYLKEKRSIAIAIPCLICPPSEISSVGYINNNIANAGYTECSVKALYLIEIETIANRKVNI